MARVSPDANDIIVMPLNDGPGTSINAGTSGATDNWTQYGNPLYQVPGLIPIGGEFKSIYIPGSHISSNRDGTGGSNNTLFTPTITLSGWIYLRRYTNFFGEVFNKQYFVNGWSNPFLTFGFQMQNTNDGSIELYITVNGSLQVIRSANFYTIQQGRWTHIGGTWDGSQLKLYINGALVNTGTFSGTIDYGTLGTRGQWYVGGIPGSSTNQAAPIICQDIRIANIARPQSYFANIYRQSFLSDI